MSNIERHSDFNRIQAEFIKYYGAKDGIAEYQTWLHALNLDENKPYGASQREKFSFVKPMLQKLREDTENAYYKVLVGFPLKSMNDNLYTQNKLSAAADGLVDAFDCDLNHLAGYTLPGVRYVAAKFEDGAVEAVLKVPKALRCNLDLTRHMYDIGEGEPLYQSIDKGLIVNQSLEASEEGGFHFTGSALLTKDTLPGIPLSKVMPLEMVVSEALTVSKQLKADPLKVTIQLRKETKVPEPQNQEADYPWDQCVSDMKAQGYSDDQANATCAAIKNRAVSHAQLYGLAKNREEAVKLVSGKVKEDKLFAYLAGKVYELQQSIIALQSEVQEKKTELSTLRLEKLKAESKTNNTELSTATQIENLKSSYEATITGLKANIENLNLELGKELKERQKQETIASERLTVAERLEKESKRHFDEKLEDQKTITRWERTAQDEHKKAEDSTEKLNTLTLEHEALQSKYNISLENTRTLNQKLTQANEDLVKVSNEKNQVAEDLKKAQRMAKVIVKM